MKTWGVVLSLIVLVLALVGPWTVGPATSATTWVRGWGIVDFEKDPRREWIALWEDGNSIKKETERWGRTNCYTGTRKPIAAILSISRVQVVGKPDTRQRWEAFVRIAAASDTDLELVEMYIHDCYSHVDMYHIEEER